MCLRVRHERPVNDRDALVRLTSSHNAAKKRTLQGSQSSVIVVVDCASDVLAISEF
jgi:hypothetical protein